MSALLLCHCTRTQLDAFADLAPEPESPAPQAGAAGNPEPESPPSQAGASGNPPCNPCADFPAEPIFDTGGGALPPNVVELFGPEGAGAAGVGPCLVEPELGSVFPKNWLRPRFRHIAAAGQTLFEIRLKSPRQLHQLVAYTSAPSWVLPASIWDAITSTLLDQPITVAIRGLDPTVSPAQPSIATTGTISIAPVEAPGRVVYWSTVFDPATQTGSSGLKGFAIGDEGVSEVLRADQTRGQCPACHTATPDGQFLGASVSPVISNGETAHIELRATDGSGSEPPFLTVSARALLARESQQMPTFSRQHWRDGDHLMVSILNDQLIWTDLEASSELEAAGWGVVARADDPNARVTHPSFNGSGSALAYTSAATGALTKADGADVYVVPFNQGQGGLAAPLPGASAPDMNEYYPAFSPDDALLAFNRAPLSANAPDVVLPSFSSSTTYNNPWGELWVVPGAGGTAERLLANDPPACTGKVSPGVTNSWGKWAPAAQQVQSRTYYFLIFSSGRVDPARPQLYVSPLVVDAGGRVSSYPALYLWNQPADEGNHTPAWGSE